MSGEPANFDIKDAARWSAQRRPLKRYAGPRPTLGDLQRSTPWLWVYCEKCPHYSPFACAVAVIRWGPNVSSDKLRRCARCTACGHKGATIQHPGWMGSHIGFQPFPVADGMTVEAAGTVSGCSPRLGRPAPCGPVEVA